MSKEFATEINVRWIKAESGTTYLCPVKALERLGNATEADLRTICVDESANPHNE